MAHRNITLGIDYGTSKCCMTWFNPETQNAEIIRNAEGEESTPSVVYYGATEVLVGTPALRMLEDAVDDEQRANFVVSPKRKLGSREVWSFPGGRLVTAHDATVELLRKLKSDAETGHFRESITNAVITVPACFGAIEREALAAAAKETKFKAVELLDEPVAAALTYSRQGLKVGRNVLVYDLGAGTFDLALLTQDDGETTHRLALEPRGDRFGGNDFDEAVYRHCDLLAQQSLGRSIHADGSFDLRFLLDCKRRKENLTHREHGHFSSLLSDGTIFRYSLDRATLEKLIQPLIDRTIAHTRELLADAKREGITVDSIVMIGGSSQIPFIQKQLAKQLSLEPMLFHQAHVAVALGAVWASVPATASKDSASNDMHANAKQEFDLGKNRFESYLVESLNKSASTLTLAEALDHLQAACDLAPDVPEYLQTKGDALLENQKLPQADAAYSACLRLEPNHAAALLGRSLIRLESNRTTEALADLDRMISLAPHVEALLQRAACHAVLKQPDEELRDLLAAQQLAESSDDYDAGERLALQALFALRCDRAKTVDAESLLAAVFQKLRGKTSRYDLTANFKTLTPMSPPAEIGWRRQTFSRQSVMTERRQAQKNLPAFESACAAFPRWAVLFNLDPVVAAGNNCGGTAGRPLPLPLLPGVAAGTTQGDIRLVETLARHLWLAILDRHQGCTREAVMDFAKATGGDDPSDFVFQSEPDFRLHWASRLAELGKADGAAAWLKRLFAEHPKFDYSRIVADSFLYPPRDKALKEVMSPSLTAIEEHGWVVNYVAASNLSPFELHDVVVTVAYRHQTNGAKSATRRCDRLTPGETKRWESVFEGTGLFGAGITIQRVEVTCRELTLLKSGLPKGLPTPKSLTKCA
ncbi:MAG: Hsp70 family protein [Planctomycetaceae bacterium]